MVLDSIHSDKYLKIYGKSEVVFEEGTSGSEMYVIRSGRVRIYRNAEEGEMEIGILEPGEFFGEMALVDNSPRCASACALEDGTKLLALDKDKFLFLVSHQPMFALMIMHVLCQKIRALDESVFVPDVIHPLI
jgi:CRP-like cAMP-binding protein